MPARSDFANAIERLTPRQQECLELTAQLYSAKEIADTLCIEPTTVEGYLAEAIRIVGAKNKREAARLFHAATPVGKFATRKIGGDSSRLFDTDAIPAEGVAEDQREGTDAPTEAALTHRVQEVRHTPSRFHLLRGERRNNDLTTIQRLAWILIVSIGAAMLFTTSITIIDSLHRLLAGS